MTGAARGIGLAAAQSLALLGAKVLMVDNGCAVDGSPEDPAVTELAAERVPGAKALVIDLAAPGTRSAASSVTAGSSGDPSTAQPLSTMRTLAPSSASDWAAASPMPRAAPVTIARLSFSQSAMPLVS